MTSKYQGATRHRRLEDISTLACFRNCGITHDDGTALPPKADTQEEINDMILLYNTAANTDKSIWFPGQIEGACG